jgi:hypothetical protein
MFTKSKLTLFFLFQGTLNLPCELTRKRPLKQVLLRYKKREATASGEIVSGSTSLSF